MEDSIELYNGVNNINVNTLDILREPNQQLANAIATGPQDEFFSALEECNRMMRMHNDLNPKVLSVTPSWNWRPGSLDIVKDYVARQLMLQKKSSGLGKYMSRTKENASYRLNYVARKLESCEEKKRMLKREGYQHDVDIDEYVVKLVDFCDKFCGIYRYSYLMSSSIRLYGFITLHQFSSFISISSWLDLLSKLKSIGLSL